MNIVCHVRHCLLPVKVVMSPEQPTIALVCLDTQTLLKAFVVCVVG